MPNRCIVKGCHSGYKSNKEHASMFQFPRDEELRSKWIAAIPPTNLNPSGNKENAFSKTNHYVCEKHFLPSEIIRSFVHKAKNGVVIADVPYKVPRLAKNVVPSIFPTSQQKLSVAEVPNESSAANCSALEGIKCLDVPQSTETSHPLPQREENASSCTLNETICNKSLHDDVTVVNISSKTEIISGSQDITTDVNGVHDSTTCPAENVAEKYVGCNIFDDIYENPDAVTIPSGWYRFTSAAAKKWVAFSTFDIKTESDCTIPLARRSVLVTQDGTVHISANGKGISSRIISSSLEEIRTVEDVSLLLSLLSSSGICSGVAILTNLCSVSNTILYQDDFGKWRHRNCTIVCNKKICTACQRLKKTINQKTRRLLKQPRRKRMDLCYRNIDEKSDLIAMRKRLRSVTAAARRAKDHVKKLKDTLSEVQNRIRNFDAQSIIDKCNELHKLSEPQKLCIKEIIAAAGRKSSQGNRYTENWAMLCMLMHIRSPSHYRFLLKNEILPLPTPRTIRRYLSVIDVRCGFDPQFFQEFKGHLETKTPMERHGILISEEILLREAISVRSSTSTDTGLTDVGDMGIAATDVNQKANHSVVLYYKAIADTNAQPVAVFASKGPVNGVDLTKIVVKAIMLLENIGAMVHGIVSDGAATNRKMWSELGMNGTKGKCQSWFTHPSDVTRKVFVFSDTPNLIKSIRNRLYDNKTLLIDPEKSPIQWEYFSTLYKLDQQLPASSRVCSKITEDHLVLNTSAKMRILLATQIFSNSVAKGLQFHLKRGGSGLEGCESTIEFCQMINDMFDSLNRKTPDEGVTPDGEDIQVLRASLRWLDEWECNYEKKLIEECQFLTKSTAHGLRVTLHGTIEMCHYLCDKFEFKYLLTGRINQDSLEVDRCESPIIPV